MPLEDSDQDGVLNYLDALPDNPAESLDKDYDGLGDEEDSSDDLIIYDHSDIYLPDAVEHISPSSAQGDS